MNWVAMNNKRFNFDTPKNQADDTLQGTILIATERLEGTRFERSVVLLMQDDKKGTFGVALNKPANESVRMAWEKLTGDVSNDDQTIVSGGPLQGPVFALHCLPSLSDVEMPGGLYVAAQVEKMQQLIKQFESPYRIVVGIAGWQPGQLETELNSGFWYTMPMDVETIFDDPLWMWETCIHEYGRQQIADIVDSDIWPDDPSLN